MRTENLIPALLAPVRSTSAAIAGDAGRDHRDARGGATLPFEPSRNDQSHPVVRAVSKNGR
jgi:hypothetical protein